MHLNTARVEHKQYYWIQLINQMISWTIESCCHTVLYSQTFKITCSPSPHHSATAVPLTPLARTADLISRWQVRLRGRLNFFFSRHWQVWRRGGGGRRGSGGGVGGGVSGGRGVGVNDRVSCHADGPWWAHVALSLWAKVWRWSEDEEDGFGIHR